jgi:hypothetical protein
MIEGTKAPVTTKVPVITQAPVGGSEGAGTSAGSSSVSTAPLDRPDQLGPRGQTLGQGGGQRPRSASDRFELARPETGQLELAEGRRFGSSRQFATHHVPRPSVPHHNVSHHHVIPTKVAENEDMSPGTSPLLSRGGSMQSDTFSIDMGALIQTTAAGDTQESDDVVIDIETVETPPALSPREQIEHALGQLQFLAPPGPQREAQEALEMEYVPWAAELAVKRQAVFGNEGYSVGHDHVTSFGEAVVPALYDGVRQFVSSSSRSPFQNATQTALGPSVQIVDGVRSNLGELDNQYDAAAIGGAVGGATAYVVESTVLTAMDRRAKLANLPQLKAVDLKTLVPDPSPVQLRLVDGRKEYWRPTAQPGGDIESHGAASAHASLAELKESADLRRTSLARAQDALDAKGWGLLAQPAVTGGFNVLRRVAMPAKALSQAVPVMGSSMLASGAAGGVTKAVLGLAKPLAATPVDNLVGGKQAMSLFATKLPDPTQPAAKLSDIGALPGHAAGVVKDSAALAAHFVAGPWRHESGGPMHTVDAVVARVDDAVRVIGANTFAGVFANAAGPFAARLLRHDSASPLPGESQKSSAYLLQQATSSFTSDLSWQTLKKAFGGGTFGVAESLDLWRQRQYSQTQGESASNV